MATAPTHVAVAPIFLARVFKTEIFHTIEVTASIWLPFLPLGQKKGIGAARNFARGTKGNGRSLDRPWQRYPSLFPTFPYLHWL